MSLDAARSVATTEERIVACDPNHLRDVITAVILKLDPKQGIEAGIEPGPAVAAAIAEPACEDAATFALDENTAHRKKIGRLRCDVLRIVANPCFHIVTTVSRGARDPLVHLHSFLEHTLTAEEIAERGAHFAQLVLGKAEATSVSPHHMK